MRLQLDPFEQPAERNGVRAQRSATLPRQCDRGARSCPVDRLLSGDVAGLLELAQVRDEVARRQPDQVLEPA